MLDGQDHHLPDQIHSVAKLTTACPILPFLARTINTAERCFANYIFRLRPLPAFSESGPQPPMLKTFGPLLRQILRQISGKLRRNNLRFDSTDRDPLPLTQQNRAINA